MDGEEEDQKQGNEQKRRAEVHERREQEGSEGSEVTRIEDLEYSPPSPYDPGGREREEESGEEESG